MAHPRMVDTYVRELLHQAFEEGFGIEGRAYLLPLRAEPVVQVIGDAGNGLRVQVTARVATELTVGSELYAALNEVNVGLAYGRVFLIDDTVWVEDTVLGEQIDGNLLDNAVSHVCWVTWTHGPELAAAGAGRPALTETPEVRSDAAVPSAEPGHVEVEMVDASGDLLADAIASPYPGTAPSVGNAAGYL